MLIGDRYSEAETISGAWLDALRVVTNSGSRRATHLVLRVSDVTSDSPEVRAAAQQLIDDHNESKSEKKKLWSVLTTRNTILPASWAKRNPEPADLAAYYRDRYPELRRTPNSQYGTYFGRLVAYPRESKHSDQFDQLSRLVTKLRREHGPNGSRKTSCYELNVYSERHDTNIMSFPCLAHLSFHVHESRLNLQAVYRNEFLVGRAYGNYLGLAELLVYVAAACPGLEPGELLLTLNHVELDTGVSMKLVKKVLGNFDN